MDKNEIYYQGKISQLLTDLCEDLADCLFLIDDESGILSAEELELMGRLSDIIESAVDRLDKKYKLLAEDDEDD